MAHSSRIQLHRSLVVRAAETGAGQRARERNEISRPAAARIMKVDPATFYRWELGITVPTHNENLSAYARWLKRIGVEDDPAMSDGGSSDADSGAESAVSA